MLYEAYSNLRVYNSQTKISLPKMSSDRQIGKGNLVFTLTPNLDKEIELLMDPVMSFQQSIYKFFTMEYMYRARIGNKKIIANERNKINAKFRDERDLYTTFKGINAVRPIINENRNLIVDLSRWMELFFTYRKVNSIKKMCEEFLTLLRDKINDPMYANYKSRLLLIDLNSWCTSTSCILMNRKLLNNPLSIIFYAAYYYPDLMTLAPDIRIMVADRASHQVVLFDMKEITKRNYPQIKTKIKLLKNLVFSVEDETSTEEMTDAEVKAEVIEEFKTDMKESLKKNLVGDVSDEDEEPDKFQEDLSDSDDVEDLTLELEDKSSDTDDDSDEGIVDEDSNIDYEEVIAKSVAELVDEDPESIIYEDPKKAAKKVTSKIKKNVYVQSFMPTRTPEQIEKVKRMTAAQEDIIKVPSKEDVAKKTIDKTIIGDTIVNGNPNLVESKFVNFDKNYVDKCMESDIDNSVAILSKASNKIFIVNKEVEDTSDSMNLKKTYTYTLQDENNVQMTIKLDIPVVLDGTYIFVNGSKKIIGHQFVLKPLVKTGPGTVQIVTAYNKVFIRRAGRTDQNTNILQTYLSANAEKYQVKDGNFSMKNKNYEVPLDFIMLSKFFTKFKIGQNLFMMDLDELIKTAKLRNPTGYKEPDLLHEIPIAYDTKTKLLVTMPLTDSYTDTVISMMTEDERKDLRKIKRRPKLIVANAKIMSKDIPVVLFAMYCEGFTEVMKKANIEYKFVTLQEFKTYDRLIWDSIQLEDCILIWKKSNISTAMLMNGLKMSPLELFTREEMDSKDTFISLVLRYYNNDSKIAYSFDNYRDFLLDEKTKEMLADFNYPTDLVSVLITAVNMLSDNKFLPENNMNNMRVRSSEVIPDIVYILLTKAYTDYRRTSYKKKPMKLAVPQSAVIDGLLSSSVTKAGGKTSIATNLVTEFSVLNPVLELEKARAVTFKGIRGIQMNRAMTLPRRAYDQSMLGVVGVSTSPKLLGGTVVI